MKPAPFELLRPQSLDEALTLLADDPDETVVLAGGQSLVPMMNLRLVHTDRVLDLNEVAELAYIRDEEQTLAIGAMTRHRTLELSPVVGAGWPLLTEAERHVGYVPVRYRGTVGGSIAHADPVAELGCSAVALDATVRLTSLRGSRMCPAGEFFLGALMTAREPDELVTEVRFPSTGPGSGCGFAEFERKSGDFPLVTAAAVVATDGGRIERAAIAVGGVAPTPVRAVGCETALAGAAVSAVDAEEIATLVTEVIQPGSDSEVSDEYRTALARVVVEAALERALSECRHAGGR